MRLWFICLVCCIQLVIITTNGNAQSNVLSAEMQDEMIIIRINDVTFTSYRYGDGQKYPYLFPLNGPISGESITTESSLPYPHHRSLWFACDRVNGGNYWQEGNDRGQIISRIPKLLENTKERIHINDECYWKQPGEESIIEDERDIIITVPSDSIRIIDFNIKLTALTDITILKTNHSLFSARMHHTLSVKEGGTLVNSDGSSGEKETAGNNSAWCDYYGERFGITEGLSIFDSPQNIWYPSKWFTRDYGFMSPTNMYWLDDDFKIKKSETIKFTYRVIIHSGTTKEAKIENLYSEWIRNQ